jgi:D-serine deaminase-like pyridoxal phosphate-dependent protein
MKVSEYDTPALLIDMDAVERNIRRMADYFHRKKASLRPHVKVHKSPALAQRQIEAGAKGITCAKISEAEVMSNSGIKDILIANEIVGEDKIRRLSRLAKDCQIGVLVDDERNARQLSRIASQEDSTIRVLVDLNLSGASGGILDRCGVFPGLNAVKLAHDVSKLKNIEFSGLMGYEGALRSFPNPDAKKTAATRALNLLVETKDQIKASGLDVDVVSCGGTMSYNIAAEFPGVTEVQAGSYIFMDTTYRKYGIDFEFALTVLTRVISRPRPEKIIVDAGLKAISADHGLPVVRDRPDLELTGLNAEHGHISVKRAPAGRLSSLESAEKLELLPSHVDTTACLHDNYVVTRRGEVETTLNIPCRGKLQ